jgi:hypothetical protein
MNELIHMQLTRITRLLVILCLLLSPIASGAMLLDSSANFDTPDSQVSVDVDRQCHHMAKDPVSPTAINVQGTGCDHSPSCSLLCSIAVELSVIDFFTRQEKIIRWSPIGHLNLKPSFLSRLDKPPKV